MQESVPKRKMWFLSFESLGYVVMLLRDASGMHPGWGSVPCHFVPCSSGLPRAWPSSPLPSSPSHLSVGRKMWFSWAEEKKMSLFCLQCFSDFNEHRNYRRRAGAGWGGEVAVGLPWDAEVAHGAVFSARSFAEEEQDPHCPLPPPPPPFQPRKQGDLITSEVTEPQRLIRSDVLSAQVTSPEGGSWSHLCPDPIFQKGVMGVTLRQGEQKGAIG